MSNWTHVSAVIRVDSFFDDENLDFTEILGKQVNYNDSEEIFQDAENNPDKYLPMGSEGSLEMTVWTNPDKSSIARYTVSIFGDLRDHDDPNEITDWFKDKCSKIPLMHGAMIRDAMIVSRNEIYGISTWVKPIYDDED